MSNKNTKGIHMRKRVFEIIEPLDDSISRLYDATMVIIIIISIFPLAFHSENNIFLWIDRITTIIFIIDYLLRLITADYKINRAMASFILYPFTPLAVIDLLSILPGVFTLNQGLKLFRLVRLFRTMRILRIFKAVRYSKSVMLILNVLHKQRDSLIAVCGIAIMYILISALVIFNVEPDSFTTFFDAIYWAVVSLTTMGYGDLYPVTTIGRIVTMISSIFGIAIVAMPASIITAGFMEEMNKNAN